ncbi:hypothetical protein [Paenibacillus eucommiae]|uniref:Uncharacterized protein n=1 Tax=Paenibacillus eucommiae TaxID=1355755 RepID=A0ABS4J3Z1_9BACL|nr:hypothetical protein [Paenibacillus eucommiae]MBP1994557.1 hypothetical protein [Paenibacillus eucommiae]
MTAKHSIPKGNAKRVAVIVTEYRFNSHADVILGRLLGDLDYVPRVEVVSLYTDQVPDNDMSVEEAARCDVPIYARIEEAIKVPYSKGGLDGVIIIGEHGEYPLDERGCKSYPRRRLLDEVLQALDDLQLNIPIFSDKHLSYNIEDTFWMYNEVQKRNIPFFAGSSIPHCPYVPAFDLQLLEDAEQLLVISYSTEYEAYGYHGLETLQSIAEKRAGGETGVRSVQAFKGERLGETVEDYPAELIEKACAVYDPSGSLYAKHKDDLMVLFVVEYVDGTKGYVIQHPNWVEQWGFAFRRSTGDIVAAICESELQRPFGHFATLTRMIEDFIITGVEPFPAKRVLFSSALINYGMDSLHQQGKRIETPELANESYSGS